MARTTKSKKAKGTRLEKEISTQLERVLGDYGVKATRMPMSGAIDRFKSDLFTNLPVSFECKNQERWSVHEWWQQCEQDAGFKMPILVMSRNHSSNYAMLKFNDLLVLMEYALQAGWGDLTPPRSPPDKQMQSQ